MRAALIIPMQTYTYMSVFVFEIYYPQKGFKDSL